MIKRLIGIAIASTLVLGLAPAAFAGTEIPEANLVFYPPRLTFEDGEVVEYAFAVTPEAGFTYTGTICMPSGVCYDVTGLEPGGTTGFITMEAGPNIGERIVTKYDSTGAIVTQEKGVFEVVNTPPPPTPLEISDLRVSRLKFFPTVRDGYKDSVKFTWRQNKIENVFIEVTRQGFTVFSAEVTGRRNSLNRFTWRGQTNSGRRITKGTYRVQVTGTDAASAQVPVKVARKRVTITESQTRAGQREQRRSRSGNCNFLSSPLNGLLITCLNGTASATYNFRVRGRFERARVDFDPGVTRCVGRVDVNRSPRRVSVTAISDGNPGWSQCWVDTVRIRTSRRIWR